MGRELGPPLAKPVQLPLCLQLPPGTVPPLLAPAGPWCRDRGPTRQMPRRCPSLLVLGEADAAEGGRVRGGGASMSALVPSASRLVASTTPATSCHSAWRWPCPPRLPPWPCRGRSGSSYASPLVSCPFSVPHFTAPPPPPARSASCPPHRRELHLLPPRWRLPLGEGAPGPHLRGGSPPAEDGP